MCDTLVATHLATKSKQMILAKNSDRHPKEKQIVEFVPAKKNRKKTIHCTHITIPQVKQTYAVLLSRPSWMFGAEMGVNEHGVAIGNEAVHSTKRYRKKGLTGMDLIRLALERSKTAKSALQMITLLIQKYGQGGNCGYKKEEYYHNTFIIADPHEAYVLETADNAWVWKKVKSIYTISNHYTIRTPDASNTKEFSSLKAKSQSYKPTQRRSKTLQFLRKRKGKITEKSMMQILRSHGDPHICRHDTSVTAGSMVAILRPGMHPLVYFTGAPSPCKSTFKQYIFR